MKLNNAFLLMGLFSAVLFFAACSPNNVTKEDSLKAFFDSSKVDGCFAMFDNGTGQFTVYNLSRYKDSAYLPASTFKIVNSLIGIETGRIVNEKMVIKWDGVVRKHDNGDTIKEWNKDLTMAEAFKISCVPYYQEVARRIGKDTMQQWLDSLKYGNRKIGGRIDSFWLNNSLKITPDEQLGLVKKLYFSQLGFQKRTQDIVKKVMLQEDNANYKLYYKTGTGHLGDKYIYWVTGFVERVQHVKEPEGSMNKSDVRNYPYFFTENFEMPVADTTKDWFKVRLDVLHSILKDYGAIPAQ